MKDLKELINFCYKKYIFGINCPLLDAESKKYKAIYGIDENPIQYRSRMNEERGKYIADAFESMEHSPYDYFTKAAYDQLVQEVIQQYEYVRREIKIDIEPYEGNHEPYKNSKEMLKDIFDRHHLYFFKTTIAFGEGTVYKDNPMLQGTGLKVKGEELLINDMFRIIHDIFGHAMKGFGFGPLGEDRAWFEHSKMFSPLAVAAITTETRGQNCWVNYGRHLRKANGAILKQSETRLGTTAEQAVCRSEGRDPA